ncbi:MAG: hypothetical protein H0W97_02925 [Actinobacteria bacterium]|nr:hypothetical protein [Actinomycetota bacterium]
MTRCKVCSFPQVSEVDTLLASGSSIRSVSQMYGLARSTLARHRQHVEPLPTRFGVIEGQAGAMEPGDPLSEALLLAERARTPRERLRALEQVRGATKLALRGAATLDQETRERIDVNVREAELAYRDAPDFETQARALSGWRAAIRERLDAVKPPEPEAPTINLEFFAADADPPEPPAQDPSTIPGVPEQFRDPAKYQARHRITLHFDGDHADEDIRIYETKTGALAWRKER